MGVKREKDRKRVQPVNQKASLEKEDAKDRSWDDIQSPGSSQNLQRGKMKVVESKIAKLEAGSIVEE